MEKGRRTVMTFLDSHVVTWLYQKELDLMPLRVLKILEDETVTISPIVILELEYLFEIGKIKEHGEPIVDYLSLTLGLQINNFDFHKVIHAAIDERWTRDPFDRIITAHARCYDALLLTKDKTILRNYSKAFWS
jgi:PIN domain nuclease of toxin-antitoxin system